MDGLLLDIDGVLTVSWEPIEGAPEAVAHLRAAGVGLAFLTNTTSRPRAEVAAALAGAGFEVAADEVLTAPAATAAHLAAHHPGARVLLVNEGDLGDDLGELDLVDAEPDLVLLGGAGPAFTYERLNAAFQALEGGAPLVAMHRNSSWRTSAGIQLDTGVYVAGLEQATGVVPTVVGKPSAAMFEAGLRTIGVEAGRAAMVGDDLDADVLGAQAAGLTGVLVRTGKFSEQALARAEGTPDHVVGSIADVPALLEL